MRNTKKVIAATAAVATLVGLAACGKKEVEQSKAAAGMLHPGAVPLQRQQGFAAVVPEDGVARGFVQ